MGNGKKKNLFFIAGPQNTRDIFNLSFAKVYLSDSWSPLKNKFNGHAPGTDQESQIEIQNYTKHKFIQLTSFLGFPNYTLLPEKLTLKKALKNLARWQDDKTVAGNLLFSLFTLIRLTLIPFNFTRNLVKLFTELLPCFLADLCEFHALSMKTQHRYAKRGASVFGSKRITRDMIFYGASFGILLGLQIFCEIIHFFGKALTSPIKGMETAWYFATHFQKESETPESNGMLALRYTVGSSLVFLSFATTLVAYSFLLPLLLSSTASIIGNTLASIPVISHIGYLFTALGLGSAMAGLAAIGTLTASTLLLPGTLVSKFMDRLYTKKELSPEVVELDKLRKKYEDAISHSASSKKIISPKPGKLSKQNLFTDQQSAKIPPLKPKETPPEASRRPSLSGNG